MLIKLDGSVMAIENASLALWFRRVKIATGVALLQLATQFINALTGFMLVRTLDKGEYALFTIASSMLAMTGTLSDLGAQTGLLSVGGKVYQDRHRLSQLVATAIRIRFIMLGLALLVIAPLSWYFLARNEASWAVATILTLTILGGTIPSTFSAVLVVPLRLLGAYHVTQLADVTGAASRLFGSALAILMAPMASLCAIAV